ncbi:phosphoinositide phosphatase sac9-related [Anaeramoeba flamelloides]|uniref:Phosphoinositide phosphatase sac9-related n=1 Tax=Anaeramoeba flamelloides TaxID=1746091 RepID=A0ABQ8Y4R1_9EUKA|nr:phosphoinositide phosphatase sac9-related [Anaeramoeba flamelloides]
MQFIISSLCTRKDTQIISIQPITGQLIYLGIRGYDLFVSEKVALEALFKRGIKEKSRSRCLALIGYCVCEKFGHLLVVVSAKTTLGLHGGNRIKTVENSHWIRIPLQYTHFSTFSESKMTDKLHQLPINNLHYYCETMDITRPYPSTWPVEDYCKDFCWNNWLTIPFTRLGLRRWCVVLLQGCALTKDILTVKNGKSYISSNRTQKLKICLITRRSNLNAGTKGYVGGLNDRAEPGNESETELIIIHQISEKKCFSWYSYIFRMGNVPINWKYYSRKKINLDLNQNKNKSKHKKKTVNKRKIRLNKVPFKGTIEYYKKIISRNLCNNITCISFFQRIQIEKEDLLYKNFQNSHEIVSNCLDIDLHFLNFDWEREISSKNYSKKIVNFWKVVQPFLFKSTFNTGQLLKSKKKIENSLFENTNFDLSSLKTNCFFTPNNSHFFLQPKTVQDRLFRFTLAEKPRLTNTAMHFFSQQIVAEICRKLGIGLNDNYSKKDWYFLKLNFVEFSEIVDLQIRQSLAEIFLSNGNVQSILFTNQFENGDEPLKKYLNIFGEISEKRFPIINNFVTPKINDELRNELYQIFLGKNNLFSNKFQNKNGALLMGGNGINARGQSTNSSNGVGRGGYDETGTGSGNEKNKKFCNYELVSAFPARCLRSIPYKIALTRSQNRQKTRLEPKISLLLNDPHINWVLPKHCTKVSVVILLNKPCIVSEVCLTVRHEFDYGHFPQFMDLKVGKTIDDLKTILFKEKIPFCGDGTKLWYSLKNNNNNLFQKFVTPKINKNSKKKINHENVTNTNNNNSGGQSDHTENTHTNNNNNNNFNEHGGDSVQDDDDDDLENEYLIFEKVPLYEFRSNYDSVSRVVWLNFYGKSQLDNKKIDNHLILGKIDVFGYVFGNKSPENIRFKIIEKETQNHIQNLFDLTLPRYFQKNSQIKNFWKSEQTIRSFQKKKFIFFGPHNINKFLPIMENKNIIKYVDDDNEKEREKEKNNQNNNDDVNENENENENVDMNENVNVNVNVNRNVNDNENNQMGNEKLIKKKEVSNIINDNQNQNVDNKDDEGEMGRGVKEFKVDEKHINEKEMIKNENGFGNNKEKVENNKEIKSDENGNNNKQKESRVEKKNGYEGEMERRGKEFKVDEKHKNKEMRKKEERGNENNNIKDEKQEILFKKNDHNDVKKKKIEIEIEMQNKNVSNIIKGGVIKEENKNQEENKEEGENNQNIKNENEMLITNRNKKKNNYYFFSSNSSDEKASDPSNDGSSYSSEDESSDYSKEESSGYSEDQSSNCDDDKSEQDRIVENKNKSMKSLKELLMEFSIQELLNFKLEKGQDNKEQLFEEYINYLENVVNVETNKQNNYHFLKYLKLEFVRLKLEITQPERDRILIQHNFNPFDFNPENFFYYRDLKSLIEIINQDNNKNKICSKEGCDNKISLSKKHNCLYCLKKYCLKCMNNKIPQFIITYMWDEPIFVCKSCCEVLKSERGIIDHLVELTKVMQCKEKNKNKEQRKYQKLLNMVSSSYSPSSQKILKNDSQKNNKSQQINYNPYISIVNSVPTNPNSPPIESILFPSFSKDTNIWFAPNECNKLEILISLLVKSEIVSITLLVDSWGYDQRDSPIISCHVGNTLTKLVPAFEWDLLDEYNNQQENKFIINNQNSLIEQQLNSRTNININLNNNNRDDNKIDNQMNRMGIKNDLDNMNNINNGQSNFSNLQNKRKNKINKNNQMFQSNKKIPPGTQITLSFPKKITCQIISFVITLPNRKPIQEAGFKRPNIIHLGKLIINTSNQKDFLSLYKKVIRNRPSKVIKKARRVEKQIVAKKKILWIKKIEYDPLTRILKLDLPNGFVSGLSYIVIQKNNNIISQPRKLLVSAIITNSKGKPISHQLCGVFLLPKVVHGTQLCYDFDKPIRVSKVIIEYISNYNGTIVPGNVSLY